MLLHRALLLLLLVPRTDPVVGAVLRESRENSRVMAHLDHLCNRIGPRLTGSTNLAKACEWTRDELARYGLESRLERWGQVAVGFDRGPWSAEMLEPEPMPLTIGTAAWSPGTDGPVTAPAVRAPTTDAELAAVKDRLRGAWVVSSARGPDPYAAAYDEAGIAGLIRSAPRELIVTSGRPPGSWDAIPTRVQITMIASQHAKIVGLLKEDRPVRLRIDVRNSFVKGPVPLHNVVADLRGSEKPEEMVIVGAHLDSWDGATGTTDNGTGVATTLEAARLLTKAGAKPRRTIRFMLFTGEEQGLLGSRAWIRANPDVLPRISAVLVHDYGTNYISGLPAPEPMRPALERAFAEVKGLDYPFALKPVAALPRGIGSDHDAFLAAGVPGFFWQQSRTPERGQTYSREHHTQHDVFSAAIPEFQRHSATVVALAAWGLANLDELLPRDGLKATPAGPAGGRRILGVQLEDDLTVLEVSPGSPAEKAGLKEGDRILRLGTTTVADQPSLREAIRASPASTRVAVVRNGRELEVPVVFPGP